MVSGVGNMAKIAMKKIVKPTKSKVVECPGSLIDIGRHRVQLLPSGLYACSCGRTFRYEDEFHWEVIEETRRGHHGVNWVGGRK